MHHENFPVETTDGYKIKITSPIFSHNEVEEVLKYEPDGIGLFSTDYLFKDRKFPPTEEEQFEIYREISKIMEEKPVVIRILNSPPPYMAVPEVKNPALGYWGIRLGILHPEIIKTQFRAILKANTSGNLKILLPGVARFSELLQVRAILSQIREELEGNNIPYRTTEIGIVTEIPATVFDAQKMGTEANFFCISPQLVMYSSAVDSDCRELSYFYEKFDPVFLRMTQFLTETGQKRKKEISMYGALTGEIAAISILLALGLSELIVDAPKIPQVKQLIRNISMMEAKKIAAKALTYNYADQLKQYCEKSLAKLQR
ncbi:putative PEP-binding protein [Desulfolucanica intricata]|uniref:putative PEP-binding protein n=1 Tax=Desulfolucanica intricata TaxID=1285191 RepID=UPI0008328119|nr:putative PEP-binding protein [Desulfolucanica intricata]